MRHPLGTLVGATLGFAAAGCCDDSVGLVGFSFDPRLSVSTSYAWVGDTMTMYAAGFTNPTSLLCSTHEIYNSFQKPLRFRFASSDPTVATLNDSGLFTARAAGVTRLETTTAGITNQFWVVVSPTFATLRITITPTTARVGDTVTVRVDAVDSNDTVVTGAQATVTRLIPPSDTLATWILSAKPQAPYPNIAFPTPLVDRLVIRRPGMVTVEAAAPHDVTRSPLRYVADTFSITIPQP